ncbi:hypothetical protein ACFWV1_26135 [Streptomyces sp. NPDC058700]|uniref:hypothetical protein n=1 Tax=Streptomyces sp. NPDC058700 TaxID=3346607 RepID=UPI003657339D
MNLMTTDPAPGGYTHTPEYNAGRADAYDDAHTLTLPQLQARAAEYAEHAHLLSALGYADRVLEMRMEYAAVTAAETELSHTDRVGGIA